MNRILPGSKAHVIGCCLILLCVLCGRSHAQQFKTVAPGVEHAEVTREIDKQPVRMNLLRLDLTKVRLDVVHAMDAAIGLEKTSSIATRHGAFAAINGGYFRLDDSIWAGDPAGALMIDGRVYSEPEKNRPSLLIYNGMKTSVDFERFSLVYKITIGQDTQILLDGINREPKPGESILFTPEFHRTSLTSDAVGELALVGNKVDRVYRNKGNNPLPVSGFLLSLRGESGAKLLEDDLTGLSANYSTEWVGLPESYFHDWIRSSRSWDIVSGVPQLIKNSKIDITWEQEKTNKTFVETKHPRTAVAKLKDGKFLMVTVDGRSESSGGMSLTDLAAYLLELGATDAMNLDGGGSSTMFLDGKVVNHPSDKEGERKVSDAILVTLRRVRKKK